MIKKKKPASPVGVRSVEVTESELAVFAKDVMNSVSSHVVVVNGKGTIVAVNTAWTDFGRKNAASRRKHLATTGSDEQVHIHDIARIPDSSFYDIPICGIYQAVFEPRRTRCY